MYSLCGYFEKLYIWACLQRFWPVLRRMMAKITPQSLQKDQMTDKFKNICFIGAGNIGTSLGNRLAFRKNLNIQMLTIEDDIVEPINKSHINHKYFPKLRLNKNLKATLDLEVLTSAEVIFMAIPSGVTVDYIKEHYNFIEQDAILVNLAKGFAPDGRTINECLMDTIPNPVCSMKGPTFARDIVNSSPTAFTFASEDKTLFPMFRSLFAKTEIYLDYTTDVKGIEILSILKNIYAIVIGIVDAHFNSPNLRFLILTKAFEEMKRILLLLKGEEETLFRYCGFGDFSLTALNDLSRNRTLGLLIGKGFFIDDISDKVVLEGKNAVNVIVDKLHTLDKDEADFPILCELFKVFNNNYNISNFVNHLLVKIDSRMD